MQRLRNTSEIFFPVETCPIFTLIEGALEPRPVKIPGKKAIVNMDTGRAVGVVGDGYRLVTNEEALEAARRCCSQVFPETSEAEWHVSDVDAPKTGSYCHIDLVHNTGSLDFEFLYTGERPDVPETFGPFIRVTNSYNGQRALAFRIGFIRKICKNGLVGPEDLISFRFDHTRGEIGESIKFNLQQDKLDDMKRAFLDGFRVLRDTRLESGLFVPVFRSAIQLKDPNESNLADEERKQWSSLSRHIEELCERYGRELGKNAYALLNALTDFASHPPDNKFVRRDRHSYQRLIGEWMIGFRKECEKPSFDVERYLASNAGKPT